MRKAGIWLLTAALLCGLCGCLTVDTDWRPLYSDVSSEGWGSASESRAVSGGGETAAAVSRPTSAVSSASPLSPETSRRSDTAETSGVTSGTVSRAQTQATTRTSGSTLPPQSTAATRGTTAAPAPAQTELRGVWVSYIELDALLKANPTKSGFQTAVGRLMERMKANGITDVFWIVRANSDAYYASSCYRAASRAAALLAAGTDPLAVAVGEAHARGLKLHAWVNPYRVGRDKSYAECEDIFAYDGKYYYIPTSEKAQALILKGIRELVGGYAVDGVHFDDYFYPAGCASETKKAEFETGSPGSGQSWGDYRRTAVSGLVRAAYTVCHSRKNCVFGVSPSHSLEKNRDQYYADCGRWLSDEGYVDYLCPQVYFGLEHATAAFDRVVDTWLSYTRSSKVKLYFGLGLYKAGLKNDTYAGTGKAEWSLRGDVLKREVQFLRSRSRVDGMAFYSYSYFDPSAVAGNSDYDCTVAEKEVENLLSVLC